MLQKALAEEEEGQPRIAIIGMAIRCPGASNVGEFWSNLRNGVESISFFNEDELRAAGIPEEWLKDPSYIKAAAMLDGFQLFDAQFFKYSAREAEFIDPQQRLFLECSVEALESAGVDPERFEGAIGVFAGEGVTSYMNLIFRGRDAPTGIARQMAIIGNDKDYLSTRVSYKLGLRGPSMTVQCGCSTSSVAVHLAIQSLLSGESDLTLAGGVSLTWLKKSGYHFVEGGILSRDGHCRPFDAAASGTVFSDGVAIVVLKRLEDAIADGDNIQAVILGSAVNNDGSDKVGFTAPSVDGQAAVIAEAMALSAVSPDSIGYLEAHGTGTTMGDPIEVEAAQQVFRAQTERTQFCGLGSLKANIGHLNTVAGVAGLIKTALCLKTGEIPPSINFHDPNPKIDFPNSPFYVPTELRQWTSDGPRRACVSSFGIGGTNAHLIVEEPPPAAFPESRKSMHLACVSAKSAAGLDAASALLAKHLREHPDENIADICYTMAAGRTKYPHVRAVACSDVGELTQALEAGDAPNVITGVRNISREPVIFLFPGQGSQHVNMGRELYKEEPAFRREIDRCAEILKEPLGLDLRTLLFPEQDKAGEARDLLLNTQYAQPAIFSVSYAAAKLWMSLGVMPSAFLGHSIGEFVAACLANVFTLEDGLRAVAARGRLMQSMPAGSMLAVMAPAVQVQPFLQNCSIAVINTPAACVAAGTKDDIAALARRLLEGGISSTLLHTSHAFHSSMMDEAVGPFVDVMRSIELKPPELAYISNVTGDWIGDDQATDPAYWGQQLRSPVQFYKGLSTLQDQLPGTFLDVGPAQTVAALAGAVLGNVDGITVQSSLAPASAEGAGELKAWLRAGAQLWLAGVPIDWSRRYEGERRQKRALPTYPFERQRYWAVEDRIDLVSPRGAGRRMPAAGPGFLMQTATWRRVQYASKTNAETVRNWLVFAAASDLDKAFVQALREGPGDVTVVKKTKNADLAASDDGTFKLDPLRESELSKLFTAMKEKLASDKHLHVVYFCDPRPSAPGSIEARYQSEVDDKLNTPIFLMRSLLQHAKAKNVTMTFVTRDAHEITGAESIDPMMALPIGPSVAGMHEYPGLRCKVIDVPSVPDDGSDLVRRLVDDIPQPAPSVITGYRGKARWARSYHPIPTSLLKNRQSLLRKTGVYFITGGLGDLGLAISKHLAKAMQARLILLSRSPVPDRAEWDRILSESKDDDRVVRIIRGIRDIEEAGGEVLIGAADVSNADQIREIVQQAIAKFGVIHGVVHAAGISGTTPIGLKTPEEIDQVLRPKIIGLAVLEQVFSDHDLDFFALFSSVSALWGRAGQVDYAAANAYLDAYAIQMWQAHKWPTISINWDTWREVGMALNTLQVAPGQTKPRQLRIGLTTDEGVRAFNQSLTARHPQVIVRKPGPVPFVSVPRSAPPAPAAGKEEPARQAPKRHNRPALAQGYRAPETELQIAVAAIWVELLRLEPIGLDDNFFELGGHSLLALQLLPRIREKYQVSLEPREFFANPTVAKTAALIEEKLVSEIAELAKQSNEALAATTAAQ